MKTEHFINKRLIKLQTSLNNKKISLLLISNPVNIAYLSGLHETINAEREIFLLILQNKNILLKSSLINIDSKYINKFEIKTFNSRKNLYGIIGKFLVIKNKLKKVHFESEDLKVAEFEKLQKEIKAEFISTTDIIENLREKKDDLEIKNIKKSCHIATRTYKKVSNWLKPGISEIVLAEKIKHQLIKHGSQGIPKNFEPIVAFGENSAIPHHKAGQKKLESEDVVLLDFGAVFNGYCSDLTRTIKLGKQTRQFKLVKNSVLKAYKQAIKMINRGIKSQQLDRKVKLILRENGFINKMLHSTGHGIGLEIHEKPSISSNSKSDTYLRKGITIALEPGIYFPGSFGYRYENTLLIKKNDAEELTIT